MENELKNKIVDINEEKTTKFDELKNQLNQFSNQDEILKNQLLELGNTKNQKIEELESDFEISKTENENLKSENENLKIEIDAVKLENENLILGNISLATASSDTKKLCGNLENDLKILETLKNTEIDELKTEITELKLVEKMLKNEINGIEAKNLDRLMDFENFNSEKITKEKKDEIEREKLKVFESIEHEKRNNNRIKELEAELITLQIQLKFRIDQMKEMEIAATDLGPSSEGKN